jgi:DNA-binding beta-propeller fold protein YncE
MRLTTLVAVFLWAASAPAEPLELPDGKGGIGFDDMLYVPALHRVLVPAGRTGRLILIEPKSHALSEIGGFATAPASGEGHGAGTTSADSDGKLIFASDRNRHTVSIIDVAQKKIVSSVQLGGGPDYVRWVEPRGEVWVTEPGKKAIEYFTLSRAATTTPGATPLLTRTGSIPVADGPESLVIDGARGRAYTHTWHGETLAIDLATHAVVARWKNGCKGSRGIALDGKRGLLFVGCDEGRATALDVAHDGKLLGSVATGKGVDIIAWSPARQHLYVPGGDDATLTIVTVGDKGELGVAATRKSAADAHCVAADDEGHAYVCDPQNGRVLIVDDKP